MPGFHVKDLKGQVNAYARGYLFNILIDSAPPASGLTSDPTPYLVRSSSLPGGTIDPIEVPWQGMQYKIGSTHTFDNWSCTFNVDMESQIRKNFLQWQRAIHNPEDNVQGLPKEYFGVIKLELLHVDGSVLLTYTLHDAWPTEVGEISLDYSSKDVAQFDVTFSMNYYTTDA